MTLPPDHTLRTILAAHALTTPIDGDCLTTAPQVTEALERHGALARTALVAGWLDETETVIGFLHTVTVCGDWVLDGTARQCDASLPAAWITPSRSYIARLAEATAVHHVRFVSQPRGAVPTCQTFV